MTDILACVRDDEVIDSKEFARRMGNKPTWAANLIRKNAVHHRNLGNGLLLLSGRLLREWVETTGDVDGGGKPTIYPTPRRNAAGVE